MKNNLNFNIRKTVQAINYFALKSGNNEISRLKFLKLLFFVDKYLIRNKGKMLSNDDYYAMKLGPVASTVCNFKEIDEKNLNFKTISSEMAVYYNVYIEGNKESFKSKKAPDLKVFSIAEKKVLDLIWERFGMLSHSILVDKTHKHPEWKQHEDIINEKNKRADISFEDFLEDVEEDQDLFPALSQDEKKNILSKIKESVEIHSLLN